MKTQKKLLTDRTLRTVKVPTERTLVWDTAVPGAYLLTTPNGNISYDLMKRIRGQMTPVRRIVGYAWRVGQQPPIPLAELRDMARGMLSSMAKGIDPKAQVRAEKEAKDAQARAIFSNVVEDFLADHVRGQKSAKSIEQTFRTVINPILGKLPITAITDQDIVRVVKPIAKVHQYRGRNTYANLHTMFGWAIGQRCYGLTVSPFEGLSLNKICGEITPRQRVLTDSELLAVWKATEAIGGIPGSFIQLLLLTGQRLREVSDLRWEEVDLGKGIITIGAKRMKGGSAHVVPLAPDALAMLCEISHNSPFVFSSNGGKKPISGFSKLKLKLDAAMPDKIAGWRFHDLRRSFRTGLSMLGVVDRVAELVIAHAQPGLHKVYDQHSFMPEKLDAMMRWQNHLRAIMSPPADNVVNLAGRR
jgi:integrase